MDGQLPNLGIERGDFKLIRNPRYATMSSMSVLPWRKRANLSTSPVMPTGRTMNLGALRASTVALPFDW